MALFTSDFLDGCVPGLLMILFSFNKLDTDRLTGEIGSTIYIHVSLISLSP